MVNIVIIFLLTIVMPLSAQQKTLSVMLDWLPGPNHVPLVIAKEKGFFAEQELSIELISPADPSDPIKLVAAQKADIAITYQPLFLLQQKANIPLIQIGSLIDQPLFAIATKQTNEIKNLADLKNKKIGYSLDGPGLTMLATMLKTANIDMTDVTLINLRFNLTQALLANHVDAVIDVMRNHIIDNLQQYQIETRLFLPEDYDVAHYDELIFVAHENADTTDLEKFLTAMQKSLDFIGHYPDESWVIMTKAYPELDTPLNKSIWGKTRGLFAQNLLSDNA